ncbi:unnamed protein product [Amoebophrya sp. A120]|nr:unnamed protein product [Amoebophrya sp. A120]|eukprot:GSA120T00017823001.1
MVEVLRAPDDDRSWDCSQCQHTNVAVVECICKTWLCIKCGNRNLNFSGRLECNRKACKQWKTTEITDFELLTIREGRDSFLAQFCRSPT